MKKTPLYEIFWLFFKIGLFTFGGGYAMMRIMHREVVEKKEWSDDQTMLDLVSIAESTPGPFAINASTFIGYRQRGFLGSLIATLGVVLPSFIVIILISLFLQAFSDNTLVQGFLKGINAGVPVLIFHAWYKLGKHLKINILNISVMIFGFVVAFFTSFPIVYLVLIMALIGLLSSFIRRGETNDTLS
jgi:chromate transporter